MGKANFRLAQGVDTYLTNFQIPDTYSQPITMLDLMSHTAGFGEISWHLGQTPLEELTSLEEFLQEYMPERVYRSVFIDIFLMFRGSVLKNQIFVSYSVMEAR